MNEKERLSDWYRRIPYLSLPFKWSHPDSLYIQASMSGLTSPAVENCRVLEIGCATGGNLLPMCQTLPNAKFVGIDLSPVQITIANDIAKRARLVNVELICTDVLDFHDPGPFDYIIAHGVYSWVSPRARDRLLELCGQLLAPNGVAYISYNTYPGWHVRGMLREMMLPVIGEGTSKQRADHARQIALELANTAKLVDPTWGTLLELASNTLTLRSDDQLLHDDLEPINDPVYFQQFVEHADRHHLKYLCPADPTGEPWNKLPKPVQAKLTELASDPRQREQYLDVVLNRSHRESILCKSDAPVQTPNGRKIVQQSWVASWLEPAGPQVFRGAGQTVKVPAVATATVLQSLYSAWPQAVAFAALPIPDGQHDRVADDLLSLYTAGAVELWGRPTNFIGDSTPSPLAKLQATAGGPITNLRHQALQLDAGLQQAIIESKTDPLLVKHSLLTASSNSDTMS